jgi:hypothetical protein
LEEARSAAASAQSLLERGGGAEEQRRAAAELLAAVSEAREAWEARGRGLEALEAGGEGSLRKLTLSPPLSPPPPPNFPTLRRPPSLSDPLRFINTFCR